MTKTRLSRLCIDLLGGQKARYFRFRKLKIMDTKKLTETNVTAAETVVDETIDLEEYAKAGRKPPKAKRYRIRIDKKHYVVEVEAMTGRELLNLAGKTPATNFMISQIFHGGEAKKIGYDEKVDFTKPGIERFRTLPLDQTDGETATPARRQFVLPQADREFLEARGLPWETIADAGGQWLLIHDFPVPVGYNTEKVITALMIAPGYPDAQIDMVYFYPPLARTDGRAINALSSQFLDGKNFQRWSRHRTAQNPWQPGEDDVSTHLTLVEGWLEKELTR